MAYGIIEYDQDGKPICEICGKAFNRVTAHVRQKHDMNEREYKLRFGFDLKKGICSEQSAEATRAKTLENYEKVVTQNLLKGGEKSRFKKGSEGRTRDKLSEQTRIMLVARFKSAEMHEIRINNTRKQ